MKSVPLAIRVLVQNGKVVENQAPELHPEHYNKHPSGIECIDIVQHHNFNVGSAIKYLWRCGLKQGESELKELHKARNYIDFEIKRLEDADPA
jgi:hypothetical protein